jgi:RNA polymerase sigma-70 factor (ECF subfamily)
MPFLRERPPLLKAFREGERAALEEVYWAYVDRVERFVARFVGRADVPDATQEIFIRAFKESARLSYDGLRDYGPWLVAIARNFVTDRARREGRELPQLPEDEVLADERAEMDEPETPWADPEVMKVVEAYLASLPPGLRGVHEQRFVQCVPQREAAARLGLSRQQLRTREERLRDGLRSALRKASLL